MSEKKKKPRPLDRARLVKEMAKECDLERKEIQSVLHALELVMRKELGKEGPGVFTLPRLLRIERIHKPARPARYNVPCPFRPGELYNISAKPAYNIVKVKPLDLLKKIVNL